MKSTIFLIGLAVAVPGWAALGGQASRSPVMRSSAVTTSTGAPYSEHQTVLTNGTVVNEYADAGGSVFAVSWSGPFQPDLKSLLGEWFDVFTSEAGKQKGHGISRMQVRNADLVVVSSGRMGAFQGRAWLASRLPAGFAPDNFK